MTESSPPSFSFDLLQSDTQTAARCGVFHTPHGAIKTPAFMPVGTQGTVKGLTAEQIRQTGAEIILANTYHLAVRPGEDIVQDLGGLHTLAQWEGPILTDSGGFQLFSLAKQVKVTDEGAAFRSHIDGSLLNLTPERAIAIQEALGSDIAMVLDHVVALPNERSVIRDALERSYRWALRCREAQKRSDQALFAIVQGGLEESLRLESARQLVDLDFPGYAIGGLSVGESHEEMMQVLDYTCPELPTTKPRYLMGVGRPEDLLAAIARGVDMFDCVMPTRNGRNAMAFTDAGPLRLRNKKYARDTRPLDAACPSPVGNYSRGTIRHLFAANEMLGPIILSLHNLSYYQWLLARAREAIAQNRFTEFCQERHAGWAASKESQCELPDAREGSLSSTSRCETAESADRSMK